MAACHNIISSCVCASACSCACLLRGRRALARVCVFLMSLFIEFCQRAYTRVFVHTGHDEREQQHRVGDSAGGLESVQSAAAGRVGAHPRLPARNRPAVPLRQQDAPARGRAAQGMRVLLCACRCVHVFLREMELGALVCLSLHNSERFSSCIHTGAADSGVAAVLPVALPRAELAELPRAGDALAHGQHAHVGAGLQAAGGAAQQDLLHLPHCAAQSRGGTICCGYKYNYHAVFLYFD